MFFPMFLGAAVVTLLFAALTIKFKKVRGLFAVLMVLALLPTAVLGLIAFGQGDLINYPGDPSAAVQSMTDAIGAQDFEAADSHVLGTLGLTVEDIDGDTDLLQQLMPRPPKPLQRDSRRRPGLPYGWQRVEIYLAISRQIDGAAALSGVFFLAKIDGAAGVGSGCLSLGFGARTCIATRGMAQ